MSERKKRVSHTADFKAKVGLEAIRSDKTINEIAQLYDVHPAQVAQWKKAILDQCKVVFEGKRGPSLSLSIEIQSSCIVKLEIKGRTSCH